MIFVGATPYNVRMQDLNSSLANVKPPHLVPSSNNPFPLMVPTTMEHGKGIFHFDALMLLFTFGGSNVQGQLGKRNFACVVCFTYV
jgi:hypothetical protein